MSTRHRRPLLLGRTALALLLSGGCAAKKERPPPPQPPWLVEARVVGPNPDWSGIVPRDTDLPNLIPAPRRWSRRSGRETSYAARLAMEHPWPEWWQLFPIVRAFFPLPSVDMTQLEEDRLAVRQWFADHGWLDAKVSLVVEGDQTAWGKRAERLEPGSAKRAIIRVQTGERWRTTATEVRGLEDLSADMQAAIQGALPAFGGAYSGADRRAAEDEMGRVMAARGHPWPIVDSVLVPDQTSHTLSILYRVDPGPPGTFGQVEIRGLDALDADRVRRRLTPRIPEGTPWDAARVDSWAFELTRLPALSDAQITPGPQEEAPRAPVLITVKEATSPGLRPRLSVIREPTIFAASAGLEWDRHHLGRSLTQLRLLSEAGYAAMPIFLGDHRFLGNHGPTSLQEVELETFLRPLDGLSLWTTGVGSLDAQLGFNEIGLTAQSGLRYRPTPQLAVAALPRWSWWRYFAWPQQQALFDPWFAPDQGPLPPRDPRLPLFRQEARVASAVLHLEWRSLDQRLSPTRGSLVEVEAIPIGWAEGDLWSRVHLSAQRFIPTAGGRVVLRPRLHAGWMHWHDPSALQLVSTRFFLGGAGDVRGWGFRALNAPGWPGGPSDVRTGGDSMLFGSLEGRFRIWPRLHAITYADVGRVWEATLDRTTSDGRQLARGARLSDLQPSVGGGFELPSPVGGIQATLAWRIRQEVQMPTAPLPIAAHLAIVQPL